MRISGMRMCYNDAEVTRSQLDALRGQMVILSILNDTPTATIELQAHTNKMGTDMPVIVKGMLGVNELSQ